MLDQSQIGPGLPTPDEAAGTDDTQEQKRVKDVGLEVLLEALDCAVRELDTAIKRYDGEWFTRPTVTIEGYTGWDSAWLRSVLDGARNRLRLHQREEHPSMKDHCLDCGSENVQVFSRVEKYDRPGLLEGEATPRDSTPQREGPGALDYRAWYIVTCKLCGFTSKRNPMVPIPERDRVCPKCHHLMKADRIPTDHDPYGGDEACPTMECDTDREARLEEIRGRIDKGQYATWRKGADSWAATDDVRWLLSEIDRLKAKLEGEDG